MLNPLDRAHLPAVRFSPRAYMGCGGWDLALAPETTAASLDEDRIPTRASRSSTRPRRMIGSAETPTVTMGCGDEMCEECEKRQQAMGCTKCKRIRKRAMMNQQELEGSSLGQSVMSDLPRLVGGGLIVFGLFYLATR